MEPAPFYEDLAEGPDGGAAIWLRATDGVRVRVATWPMAGAKGTVLIFPGRTEYIEKYGRAAAEYARRGFAVAAIDWRGQGLADRLTSDRGLGHVGHFRDYQRDVAVMLGALEASALPQPFFLVGHSMGGAIGLRSIIRGLPVAAAAFSGPMWGIMLTPAMRPMAWALSELARAVGHGERYAPGTGSVTYVLGAEFEGNTLTRDAEYFEYMRRQLRAQPDLALGGPSLHWLNEALFETWKLKAHPLPDVPVQVHLGTNERIVSPHAIRALSARWRSADLVVHGGAEHELMMELPETRLQFFDQTAKLFGAAALGGIEPPSAASG